MLGNRLAVAVEQVVTHWRDTGRLPGALEDFLFRRRPRFLRNLEGPIISDGGGGEPEGVRPKEIAIFGRTEAVLHDRAEPALEAAGVKGQLLNDDDDPADEDHVSLGTMHRAKGLEFKAVAVVGCDVGLLPLRSVLDGFTDLSNAICSSSKRETFCTSR